MNSLGFSVGNIMFTIMPIIMLVMFVFVFGIIIYRVISTAKDKTKPIIPVRGKIVSKRTRITGQHSSTSYYATFELENGERMEFAIPSHQAGFLVEGDSGILSFQGSLFVKFERI